jgi:hypothetical protein
MHVPAIEPCYERPEIYLVLMSIFIARWLKNATFEMENSCKLAVSTSSMSDFISKVAIQRIIPTRFYTRAAPYQPIAMKVKKRSLK